MRYLIVVLFLFNFSVSHSQQIVEDIGHYTVLSMPVIAGVKTLVDGDREGMFQLVKSFAVQTGTTIGLKYLINRERPNGGDHSFPSGHSSLAFMSSTFMWKRYGWKWGVPATIAAGYVGFSRAGTEDPVHFWGDVAAGALLGALSSYIFTTKRDDNLMISLRGDSRSAGITISYNLTN